MLLILRGNDKIRDGDQLDQLIKAQLPDIKDPKQKKLFEIVTQNMLHGPCGEKCLENVLKIFLKNLRPKQIYAKAVIHYMQNLITAL